MGTPSWIVTLVTQTCLCVALFFAFNVGQRQVKPSVPNRAGNGRRPLELYFISVRGGFRPLKQQTHLLRQMGKVAKIYKAKFVVNISELGEDDPLMCNLRWHWAISIFESSLVFNERFKRARRLLLHEADKNALWQNHRHHFIGYKDLSNGTKNDQMHWLVRILESSSNNWCIVAGFHSMAACEESDQMETNKNFEPLSNIFLKFGVVRTRDSHIFVPIGQKFSGI